MKKSWLLAQRDQQLFYRLVKKQRRPGNNLPDEMIIDGKPVQCDEWANGLAGYFENLAMPKDEPLFLQ